MKYISITLFFLLIVDSSFSQSYQLSKGKLAGIGITALASFTDGIVEGYEFDGRMYFETKHGASPTGFFGSKSWERRYTHPNIWNQNLGVFDFYHVADDIRKIGYISGGLTIGISSRNKNKKWWHYGIDLAATLIVSSASKRLGMHLIRN